MGQCYWILLWDDWGIGLNMINPRMLSVVNNKGEVGFLQNSFRLEDGMTDEDIVENHNLEGKHYKIFKTTD